MCVLLLPIPSPRHLSQTHWGLFGPSAPSACTLQLPADLGSVKRVQLFQSSLPPSADLNCVLHNLSHQFLPEPVLLTLFYVLSVARVLISLCIGLPLRMLTNWNEAGMTPGNWTPKLFCHREQQSLPGGPWQQRPTAYGQNYSSHAAMPTETVHTKCPTCPHTKFCFVFNSPTLNISVQETSLHSALLVAYTSTKWYLPFKMEILFSSHLSLMDALGRYCTNNLSECVSKKKRNCTWLINFN